MTSEIKTNLGEPFENPLGAEHVGGSSHKEADMEGCLPHGSSVLNIPAVFSEEVRVSLRAGPLHQSIQQRAALELETESFVPEILQRHQVITMDLT